MTAPLFIAQRATAAILVFAVSVHLATIIYAVRGGLDAADVLARTKGNGWFLALYLVFVIAVAIHAPIGLRTIFREWTPWRGPPPPLSPGGVLPLLLSPGLPPPLSLFSFFFSPPPRNP